VSAVTVMETTHAGVRSRCFHIRHLNGDTEDFSYRKCLDTIFPGERLVWCRGCMRVGGVLGWLRGSVC